MKIYLIRHGESTANEKHVWTGQSDYDLSAKGIAELESIKSRYKYPQAELSFSSPLVRCVHSFRILYEREPDILVPQLMECKLGELEGMPYSDISADPAYISWIMDPERPLPGGESFRQFSSRATSAFVRLIGIAMRRKVSSAVVMVHGDVMRAILHRFASSAIPHRAWNVPNGCVYVCETDKNGTISNYACEPDFLF